MKDSELNVSSHDVAAGRKMCLPDLSCGNEAARWHIGSNLKAITAHVVAGIAVAQGAISWSTTLAQAYPELAGTMRAEYRDVTLRQLLGHIGGIIPNVPNPSSVAGSGSLTAQRAAIASWATAMMPTGGGVGQYTYSNVGFMIAANMIERALSSPWEQSWSFASSLRWESRRFGWGPAPAAQNPVGHLRNGSAWIEFPTLDDPPDEFTRNGRQVAAFAVSPQSTLAVHLIVSSTL